MEKRNIVRNECLYTNQNVGVSVFKGVWSGRTVAVKEQVHMSLEDANYAVNEAMNQKSLRHRSICTVYEFWLEAATGGCFKSIIVEELMEGDLAEEVRERKSRSQPWNEEELLLYLKDIAEACEYARSMEICHRDIKPHNIFIVGGRVKLGDFGSSSNTQLSEMQQTLQGSPFFLSPELKAEFARKMVEGPGRSRPYNPYQSDVYSLGLTFLHMALLDPPKEMMNLDSLAQTTATTLQRVQFPTLRSILEKMLAIEPEARIPFSAIVEEVDKFFSQPSLRSAPESEERLSLSTSQVSYPITVSNFSRVETLQFDFEWEESIRTCQNRDPPSPQKPVLAVADCCVCKMPVLDEVRCASEQMQIFAYAFSRLCSQKCVTALAQQVAQYDKTKCVACRREVNVLSSRPLILKCSHCYHDKNCLYRNLEERTGGFHNPLPTDCQICKFPIDLPYWYNYFTDQKTLFKKIRETSGINICLKCGREATLKLPCRHFVCEVCCPSTCRKYTCIECGGKMER